MERYVQKIIAFTAGLVVFMFNGALILASIIGMSTLSDDAILLNERMPRIVNWLLGTPWYVPVLITLLIILYAAWVFRPDFDKSNAYKAALLQYKKSNDDAWSFKPEFMAFREETLTLLREIKATQDQDNARLEALEASLATTLSSAECAARDEVKLCMDNYISSYEGIFMQKTKEMGEEAIRMAKGELQPLISDTLSQREAVREGLARLKGLIDRSS